MKRPDLESIYRITEDAVGLRAAVYEKFPVETVAVEALVLAQGQNLPVIFEYQGMSCRVDPQEKEENLLRRLQKRFKVRGKGKFVFTGLQKKVAQHINNFPNSVTESNIVAWLVEFRILGGVKTCYHDRELAVYPLINIGYVIGGGRNVIRQKLKESVRAWKARVPWKSRFFRLIGQALQDILSCGMPRRNFERRARALLREQSVKAAPAPLSPPLPPLRLRSRYGTRMQDWEEA